MPITYTNEERAEILRLAGEAAELRDRYWDKKHELENALSFEVDDLDSILASCPSEDCTDEEFQTFARQCLDSSELMEEEEEA
jgi:hypothetical protein